MSWSGKRPLTPNFAAHETIAFQNHGFMYVSQDDLGFLNFFVAPGLIFAAIGLSLTLLHKVAYGSEIRRSQTYFLKMAGTIAQCLFIVFLPVWLFANLYTALAMAIDAPERLLFADIATGALMVGWWMLMEHGTILKNGQPSKRSLQ
jgi:hypothetical protein